VAGLALALAWPYFPVLAAIMGAPRFAAQGIAGEWELFYNKFPLRLAPAGLGLVYFAHAVRTRTWDWLGWSLAAVASIYLLNPITAQNSLLSRYVVFLALLLHCGVIRSVSLALGPSAESGSPLGPRMARVVLAAYVLILFGGGALEARDSVRWFGGPQASASVTPAGDRGNRAIIRRFKAFAPFLGPSSVVMAKLEESWVLPAVADARVVGVLHGSPFMRDFEARRDAVTRFFDPGVSASERKEICARYGVTHVLLHRADVGRLPGLGPPATQAVHADDFYELRTLVPPTPPGP
jgi:hypothetical protein